MSTLDFITKVYYKILSLFVGKQKIIQIKKRSRMLKKAKIIQMFGEEAIIKFAEVVHTEEVCYWLFWGTLLGSYREKGFIKHDTDIDIGMFDTDITISLIDKMIDSGFIVLNVIVDKDFLGGYHIAFDYKGVKFDIYSFHKKDDDVIAFNPVPYNYTKFGQSRRKDIMDIVHVTMPCWSSLIKVPFEHTTCLIPSNASDLLRILYGDDFMTPIIGKKPDDKENPMIVHENPNIHYACVMNYETFKMIKRTGLL